MSAWLPASEAPTEKPSGWVEGEICGEDAPPVESPSGWVQDFPECEEEEPEPEPTLSPIIHWPLDEASGAVNWVDVLGGVPLTRGGPGSNGLISVPGRVGSGVTSESVFPPAYDTLGTIRTTDLGVADLTKGLSLTFWGKIVGEGFDDLSLFSWYLFPSAVSAAYHLIWWSYSNPDLTVLFSTVSPLSDISKTISVPALFDGDWHLFAAVHDPITGKIGISIDGSALVYSTGSRSRLYGAYGLCGTGAMNFADQRYIDDVKLWDRALTNSEIQSLLI